MKATIIICALALLAACKKSNSDAPAGPLQAKFDGKQMKTSNPQIVSNITGLNYTLTSVTVNLDGSSNTIFTLFIACDDVSTGQTIDLATDDGKAYLNYTISNGDAYGAGYNWTGSSGKVVIMSNQHMKRKIEGTFSGELIELNTFKTHSCTEGHFSFDY